MRINDKENYYNVKNSITMNNLQNIIKSKNISPVKVAVNSYVGVSTINSYMNGQKIPSVPTLICIAKFLNCNIDYLLDRTNNPININELNNNTSDELNLLFNNIRSLSKDKQNLVIAYVKGLLEK